VNPKLRRYAPAAVIGSVVVVLALGLVTLVMKAMDAEVAPPKKVVQVTVFRPPPPPPPEVEPPPPEVQEEVELPEPDPQMETPDVPDMPSADLGLDAEGVAGSDAFGLVGNKGGRGLLAGGARYQWYASRVKDQMLDYLASRSDVKSSSYSIVVQVWIRGDGRLSRYELGGSTGDERLDRALAGALDEWNGFGEAPPDGMPQPVRLRIVSRA